MFKLNKLLYFVGMINSGLVCVKAHDIFADEKTIYVFKVKLVENKNTFSKTDFFF